jgi:two-component system OmpR family response regulator
MSFIAIVEDNQDQRENLVDALERRGFEVKSYKNRKETIQDLQHQQPSLLISDIILEGEFDGGFLLCEDLLKLYPNLSVIFMTERVDEVDQVTGLRLGAVDYLPKPFSIPVIAAKIASHLKRQEALALSSIKDSIIQSGALHIKEDFNEVSWKGQAISLTVTELKILIRLIKGKGRVLSKDQLSDETRQSFVEANTINTHIKNIRKKIRKVDAGFDAIKSEYGLGYKWVL